MAKQCRSVCGMHVFLDAGSLGGLLAGVPDHLGVDGLIAAMVAVAGKQPGRLGLRSGANARAARRAALG